MLSLLNQYSKSRFAWLLLFFSTFSFEITALYFQYGLGLAPCTLCIYQRCAIFGIMSASIIALIAPKYTIIRLTSISIWLFSAYKGFTLAIFHAHLQFEPSLNDTCSIKVQFPTWLPLDSWIPSLFNAYGSCADKIWTFLTIEMSQWMIIIFACYLIVGLSILISQFFSSPRVSIWSK
ncbi:MULTISPECIES: disulfide bond formation protein DsbB [unclassified Gilliamella]|uniref:disulfide bond formation protein DsbB n=1 Tax=unclassified Gilliamella TaxID=2685620 RepID=UPI0013097F53|nr:MULTISPECIES: disulfide bond formation protein DsbB [unclassified Gilliamella]MWP50310.1 disulfide bond formation protein DsbB [Gilliamella sp. Lep-s35]MWP70024.1 disulfide bond formation protein DsbB [Gilliamella sp. Lep-s5]MWP78261.1 disulfide bond formation protein DsbB [Gilliamella sp. Lep-s21]